MARNPLGRQEGGTYLKHIDMEYKICNRCEQKKPATTEFFSPHSSSLNSVCKKCAAEQTREYRANLLPEQRAEQNRRHTLKRLYNLTQLEYEEMVRVQNGLCAICKEIPPIWEGRKYTLVVDHCHERNVNRELLCNKCNRVLGLFGDDVERFINAAIYLLRHQGGDANGPYNS